ncbi:MAG: hypothetical protein HC856_03530 [Pseudanabaena sp. RU_4_16]|nr:hypothetical protein [Pseudanabaena sp. RU_4_16]
MKDIKDPTGALTKGEEVVVRGIVLYVNLEPMAWCANGSITISATNHGELVLQIVGGRRPQCPRADVWEGDSIEVYGIVTEENAIALANPEKHYLRRESC